MLVKQLSVFVENKPGRLSDVIEALGKNNIDISALSLADTSEYGILRLIVNKPDEAKTLLRESGVIVKIAEVVAVPMDDTPGGLSKILSVFSQNGVNVEMSEELFNDDVKSVESVEKQIRSKLRDVLGIGANVHLVNPKSIQRSEGKAKRVIDNRKLK